MEQKRFLTARYGCLQGAYWMMFCASCAFAMEFLRSKGVADAVTGAVLAISSIITLFGLSDQAAVYCLEHLRTVAFINIVLSLYVPLFGVFQGANHSGIPAIVATGALTTRVLVTYLFKDSGFLGYRIIWWNGLFGFGMGFLISWTYYLSGRWQRNASVR